MLVGMATFRGCFVVWRMLRKFRMLQNLNEFQNLFSWNQRLVSIRYITQAAHVETRGARKGYLNKDKALVVSWYIRKTPLSPSTP